MGIIDRIFKSNIKKISIQNDEIFNDDKSIEDTEIKDTHLSKNLIEEGFNESENIYEEYVYPSLELLAETQKENSISMYKCISFLKESNKNVKFPILIGETENKDIIIEDLADINNILIAGATGTGKSILLNSIIINLIYFVKPNELKFILIDCKGVEFSVYSNIPHMLIPVVTDSRKAIGALNWINEEIKNRYKILIENNVKDINSYNQKANTKIPNILVIIDDFFDLTYEFKTEANDIIESIISKARNVGINMIISSQSVSKNIISESIKSNILNRISFKVSSEKESIAILDKKGADRLVPVGEILYKKYNSNSLQTIKGIYIDNFEIKKVVEAISINYKYNNSDKLVESFDKFNSGEMSLNNDEASEIDELFDESLDLVVDMGQVSASMLQRRFKIGYSRAGRIIDQMEERGLISGYEGSKPRQVIISKDEWEELKNIKKYN